MAVTIKQIAELAGVSRGTVDKVLNKRPGVKDETRELVLQIAKELNYQPNFLGKALVQSQSPVKIGIILTPEHNPFIQAMLTGIKKAESEFSMFGLDISVQMPITLEPAEQINLLSQLESSGVNGIALFPIEDDGVKEKVNQLVAKGIEVLTFNSRLEGIKDFCFVGQNHVKGGRTAAALMTKLMGKGGKLGVIISSASLSCHRDRYQGFKERIAESHLPVEIVEYQENQDRKDEAFRITLQYLQKYPDLAGIYITGGGVGGVGSALKLKKMPLSFRLICHDLTGDSIDLLNDKTVDFVIGQNPEEQGYQIVKLLFDRLVKKLHPKATYEIPIDIITKESL